MSEQSETGIYIFCGIQTDQEEMNEIIEVEGKKTDLFLIHYKDAAMVAAEVPLKIYQPNKENLMMHQHTVSKVMKQHRTVIPISFGNVFNSREDVKVLLENLYPQLTKLFPEIQDKIELGLKVVGKKDWLESIVKESPELKQHAESVNEKSEAASYYERIQLGGIAQKLIASIQQEIEEDIYHSLDDTAVASKLNDPLGEKMLLNASFLIDYDQEEQFDEKVNKAHEKWKDKVDFKYTGPWPAYNFVNIRLTVDENA
ncbi:GvpL/GvpF family gas vesicle protein [Pseudalkalibacillus berkeleyi]|uniref:GvpL/GvpF family gas vesicle protein n=1 Tax=Pseudalkalibacillus berkeleyi TaxID=1069813 RepID=A0ABS9H0B5_9BACL|nr:GvpL/GvpF family gas vesicle protein [Pseudalkalibacillus berkeleyi]MCF6137385.1 GvpL/GvpF family gas vesicle protein [Pseudalkalibacillus berkeleyi]